MGRHNKKGHAPQRSRLIADREARTSRASMAFTLFRPVTDNTSNNIYSRLRPMQHEEDIPSFVHLYPDNHHCTIIQERRMRKGLLTGFAAGFAVSSALGHLESGLPGHGRGTITARVESVSIIGRNRNVILANVKDDEGVLARSRQTVGHILSSMGLNITIDKSEHVTLGESRSGLTVTESRHVEHVAAEALMGLEIKLEPVVIELDGQRAALSDAKSQLDC